MEDKAEEKGEDVSKGDGRLESVDDNSTDCKPSQRTTAAKSRLGDKQKRNQTTRAAGTTWDKMVGDAEQEKNEGKQSAKGAQKNGDGNASSDESDTDNDAPQKGRPPLVDHTYNDHALVTDDHLRLLDENSPSLPAPANATEAAVRARLRGMACTYGPMKRNAGGVVKPFPGKLADVLDRTDLADVIGWQPHGRAFRVHKPKSFAANVLPRYFKQTKYLSFTRQLNLWGFKRISRGTDAGAYYHELFLRGRPYLAMRMRRIKVKGTGMKLTPNPEGEPNFYRDWPSLPETTAGEDGALPPLPPLPTEGAGLQQQQAASSKGGMQQHQIGAAAGGVDRVSENMLNALKYGAAAEDTIGGGPAGNAALLLQHQAGMANWNQLRFPAHAALPQLPLGPQQLLASVNLGNNFNDLLLAPEMRSLGDASQLQSLIGQQNQSAATGGGTDRSAANAAAPPAINGAAPGAAGMHPQNVMQAQISNQLLMERLRSLPIAPGGFGALSQSAGNGLGQMQQFAGQLPYATAQLPGGQFASLGTGGNPFARVGSNLAESSVKGALRDASQLEEMALASRAKAQSLALAGVLQAQVGGVLGSLPNALIGQLQAPPGVPAQQTQPPGLPGNETKTAPSQGPGRNSPNSEGASGGDSRPSFGRPFGRKD